MRIQKYLSQQGILSRREAERYLLKGWIKVNGQVVTALGTQIDPDRDEVTLTTALVQEKASKSYWALYKPRGIVTTVPQAGEKAIKDILPARFSQLYPVGRLDKDSEGLILLTDDGVFAKTCLQSQEPHERVYEVWVDRPMTDGMCEKIESGLMLFGERCKPCKVVLRRERVLTMTLWEGKNRQIRRMIQKVGARVTRLKRIRFGTVGLGTLRPGEVRRLSSDQVATFGADT